VTLTVPRQMNADDREGWIRAVVVAAHVRGWLLNPRKLCNECVVNVTDSTQSVSICLHIEAESQPIAA
jgi:hypothetical protein